MHDVFWCVLCVWAKLPEIKLDDDDDDDDIPGLLGSYRREVGPTDFVLQKHVERAAIPYYTIVVFCARRGCTFTR